MREQLRQTSQYKGTCEMKGALDGVRVLDLTPFIPGIYCTMLLGDMGAEVIKIEPPGGFKGLSEPMSRRLAGTRRLERNKKSMILNLRTEEGKGIFFELAKDADVVLEGYRPGTVKRLGIDYEPISKCNSRIIYVSLSGFGQDGPYADLPGFDPIYAAIGGALAVVGDRDGRPVQPLNFVGDLAGGGLHGAFAIVTALYAREKLGKGQYIDLAMTDGIVSTLTQAFALYWYDGQLPRRGKDFDSGGLPDYNIYETKDNKYLTVAALLPAFWGKLCTTIGQEELIPRQSDSGEQAEEVKQILQSTFLTKRRDEWFQLLSEADVPVAKVYELDEVEKDPHLLHRKMFTILEDIKSGKKEKAVGIPAKFSKTPGSLRSLPPEPGENTSEILTELGYNTGEIAKLKKKGIVA
jgi:crotonobetainyl-CoA:carnitine CoA-transferase CaiB-like acyl-CoA transferase